MKKFQKNVGEQRHVLLSSKIINALRFKHSLEVAR